MNFKYKLGTVEVIASIIGTLLFVLIGILMKKSEFPYIAETAAILIAAVAALYGPSAAGIAAVAASVLLYAVFGEEIVITHVVSYLLIAVGIGHYAGDFGVREGNFRSRAVKEFIVIHFLVQGFIWLMFIPFSFFMQKRTNLFEMLQSGVKSLLFTLLADLILVPAFLIISLLCDKWRIYRKNASKRGLKNY